MTRPTAMDETWEPAASTLGTITDVALPPAVRGVLVSLRPPVPPGQRRSRRGFTGGRPLTSSADVVGPDDVGPPPSREDLRVGAVHRRGRDGEPLQEWWVGVGTPPPRATPMDARLGRTPAQVAAGRGPLRLLLVPADVDPAGVSRSDALRAGITEITWSFASTLGMPPPETVRRRDGGDSTLVDVRGHPVSVRFADPAGTHLVWRTTVGGAVCLVRMRTPFAPVHAVERLADDPDLLPGVGSPAPDATPG